jgi:hypothetical protein
MKRRTFIQATAGAALLSPSLSPSIAAAPMLLSERDAAFLDDLEQASFRFFWEAVEPSTGLVCDRAHASGDNRPNVASIAATGFGLTALCIAHKRGWRDKTAIEKRVRDALKFLRDVMPQERGFFYHFVDAKTGERVWKCELSSIDTAILLCGVLSCRGYFADAEIGGLATAIYERIEWDWLTDGLLIRHGWKPESGFLAHRWDTYCEHMMLYLLAIGAPQHAISEKAWHAWKRPWFKYDELLYINPTAPLFVHQFSHAWYDFRNRRDDYTNYFENSVKATQAHRAFCAKLNERFPYFGNDVWGITASDSMKGYKAWGGPPEHGDLDGTLVPCAAAGSLPFAPRECLACLQNLREKYPRAWKYYGFVDAFQPTLGWYDADVIGIDVGITLLMAENARSGFVWEIFMKNPEARHAMQKAGFR